MLKKIKALIDNDKGTVIIEVSMAMIIIMGLFIGYVMYTNAMRYQLVMSMAAKEGARTYMAAYKKYSDISRAVEEAKDKAESELIIGGVPGATVKVEDKEVTITKPYGFYIPATNSYLLNLEAGAQFHEEVELEYYY